MPTFTFVTQNGKSAPEEVKGEFADLDLVHSEALLLAANCLNDFGPNFWRHPVWTVHVLDEAGTEVLVLNISGQIRERKGQKPSTITPS